MLAFLLTLPACDSGESRSGKLSPSPSFSQTTSPTKMPSETSADFQTTSPTNMPSESYSEVISEPLHPCGPSALFYEGEVQENFLHWARDGSRLVFNNEDTIWTIDLEGGNLQQVADVDLNYQRLVDQPGSMLRFIYAFHADVAPDGSRIVYSTCEYPDERLIPRSEGIGKGEPRYESLEAYELGTVDVKTDERKRLTKAPGLVNYPSWSPDGEQIAFVSYMGWGYGTLPLDRYHYPNYAVYQKHVKVALMAADGSSSMEGPFGQIESTARVALFPPVWSPDGQRLAYLAHEGERYGPFDTAVFAVRLDGSELTRIGKTTTVPTWSSNSEELAFASVDGESQIIYAVKPDGTDLRTIWRSDSGNPSTPISQVLWSPDGSELLFLSDGAYLVRQDGSDLRLLPAVGTRAAWSPDGSRIAIYEPGYALYTMSRDGTDLRVLAEADRNGELQLAQSTKPEATTELEPDPTATAPPPGNGQ